MRLGTTSHWRLLTDLLRPHRRAVVVLGVVLAISSALPLVGPQLLRAFIDQAAGGATVAQLVLIAGVYATLGIASQVAVVGTTYAATKLAWTATNDLRERASEHVLGLDLGYHAQTSPGSLIERIDGDATAISQFFTDFVVRVVGAGLTLAGAVVLVAYEDWRVGVAMAVFVVAAAAVTLRLRDRAVAQTAAERAEFAGLMGLVEEQLAGSEDLRALGAGGHAVDRHELASARFMRTAVTAERTASWIWVSTTGFFAGGGVLMLVTGALLQQRGVITVGTVFLLFQYTQVLRRPVELIAEQLQQVQRAAAGAGRMRELLDEPPALTPGGSQTLPDGPLGVAFDGVGFAYTDDHRTVLEGIDLRIPAGTVVGLVGHTGSGKTTLARLALRLADPTRGTVRVAGVDLRDADPAELRRRVAVVTQDVQLFTTSVRENLTLFATPPPDAVLERLLRDLGLREWLAGLPRGLDTILGEESQLSSGQAQLVGLGRAFLREPGLVLLDEASSRIDPGTAVMVERALDRLLRGRTALVIAHRLSAVERADMIVVLDHGRIVEAGPRTALAADRNSRFRALLRAEAAAAGSTNATPLLTADAGQDREAS